MASLWTTRTLVEVSAVLVVFVAIAYTALFNAPTKLSLTSAEVDALMPETTFVHVGGPHRGGTSLVWKLLREHPDITSMDPASGHADEGPDGILFQDLYPKMGIERDYLVREHALLGTLSTLNPLGHKLDKVKRVSSLVLFLPHHIPLPLPPAVRCSPRAGAS